MCDDVPDEVLGNVMGKGKSLWRQKVLASDSLLRQRGKNPLVSKIYFENVIFKNVFSISMYFLSFLQVFILLNFFFLLF